MNKLEEIRLVTLCVVADGREAFGKLVEAYQQPLRRFLLHLTGDDDLADDLAQETFIKAYLAVRGFKALSGFKTWLFRIAYNEFYDHRRKQHEVAMDDGAQFAAEHTPSDGAGATEARMSVEQAMATLSDIERAAVSLYYIQDMAIAKVADILQIPQGTVKSHLHRAKQKMAKVLS